MEWFRLRMMLLLGAWLVAVAGVGPARAQVLQQASVAQAGVAQAGVAPMGVGRGADADFAVCDAAGQVAERQYDVPAGLLRAIGRAESGRRDPGTGRMTAWPWTINAEGAGQAFGSRAEAVTTTAKLRAGGVASIDVGCFQVNLVHHKAAFATLDEGFDPARNADYAARFLVALRTRTGSWESAVAAYHSATPELGGPYRDRVLASWARDGGVATAAMREPAPPTPAVVPMVRMVTWSPTKPPAAGGAAGGAVGGAMRIWTPSAVGQGASVIRITRG